MNKNNLNQLQQLFANNPLFRRAQEMAKGKSEAELEQIARNLCQQKGISFEQAWQNFQNMRF